MRWPLTAISLVIGAATLGGCSALKPVPHLPDSSVRMTREKARSVLQQTLERARDPEGQRLADAYVGEELLHFSYSIARPVRPGVETGVPAVYTEFALEYAEVVPALYEGEGWYRVVLRRGDLDAASLRYAALKDARMFADAIGALSEERRNP